MASTTTAAQAEPGFAIVSSESAGYKKILHSGANFSELRVWMVAANAGTLSLPNSITLTPVVNNLTTSSNTSPLSATQGKALDSKIGGPLAALDTTNKTSLIAAINELNTRLSVLES